MGLKSFSKKLLLTWKWGMKDYDKRLSKVWGEKRRQMSSQTRETRWYRKFKLFPKDCRFFFRSVENKLNSLMLINNKTSTLRRKREVRPKWKHWNKNHKTWFWLYFDLWSSFIFNHNPQIHEFSCLTANFFPCKNYTRVQFLLFPGRKRPQAAGICYCCRWRCKLSISIFSSQHRISPC